jgi:hypothetical protein
MNRIMNIVAVLSNIVDRIVPSTVNSYSPLQVTSLRFIIVLTKALSWILS